MGRDEQDRNVALEEAAHNEENLLWIPAVIVSYCNLQGAMVWIVTIVTLLLLVDSVTTLHHTTLCG